MTFLKLDSLRKQYFTAVAVDTVSLEVEKGEFVSLLGPSGCGKTTTLQMIAGFIKPTGGTIFLDDLDLGKVRANKRGLGVVFQSYALFPHMTVTENVAFGLEMRGVPDAERSRRVANILELMHLGPMKGRLPSQLSGGQRQRVALARALVIEPPILLLDEPLSNLDAKLREDMQIELRRVQRSLGTTTIMVTHDQAEAMALSDRIALMNHGRIEQVGPPHEVYEKPDTAFVSTFLGKTNMLHGHIHRTLSGARVLIVNDVSLPLKDFPTEQDHDLSISLRPEKIWLRDGTGAKEAVMNAKVQMRIFCGDHWVYELDSPIGRLMVRRQNDGSVCEEGQAVSIGWSPEDMKIVGDAHA